MARAVAVAVVLVAAGCGRAAPVVVPPKAVPRQIVPTEIGGGADSPALTLDEFKEGAQRIASAGPQSMVAEGRVWEIRRGTTLVGALQVSTLKPRVDVTSAKQRATLAGLVLSGSVQRIETLGVEVVAARTADKVVYLWFGDQLFEVLQVKGAGVNPEAMLKSILEFQKPTGELRIRTATPAAK